MEEKKLTEKESLELISQMIQETKNNLEKGDGNFFLLWGYLSTFISLIIYFVWSYTANPLIFWCWWIIPIIGWPAMMFIRKKKPKRIITYIDRIIGDIWLVLGFCALAAPILSLFVPIPILFIEALLINIGAMITGLIIRYKMISITGFIGILMSFGLLFIHGEIQILIFAAMFVLLMIIPGHMLNAAYKKQLK